MLSPSSLFNLENFPDKDIFSNSVYAWNALKQIKKYMARKAQPNFSHRCLPHDFPLENSFIIHNNKLRNARECIISFGDTTKGKRQVLENG